MVQICIIALGVTALVKLLPEYFWQEKWKNSSARLRISTVIEIVEENYLESWDFTAREAICPSNVSLAAVRGCVALLLLDLRGLRFPACSALTNGGFGA